MADARSDDSPQGATSKQGPVFEARWTAPSTWHIRPPWGGWVMAPGTWKQDEAAAAVRRMYGAQETKGARVVVVTDGVKAP